MVKIPDLPGNYRTGDVVNGHVLSPRGHWVSLADAASRGVRPRRYLDTQVSTVRDPNAPTQVMRGRAAAPPPVAPPGPTHVPGPSYAPGQPPAPLPRIRATPSASGPVAAPPPVAAPARVPPSGTAARPSRGPGGPTTPPPTSNQRSGRGKIFGFLVVAFILFQLVSGFLRNAGDLFSGGTPWDSDVATTTTAVPITPVDAGLTHQEWWVGPWATSYLVEVEALNELTTPVAVEVTVEAYDAEGTLLGTGSSWVALTNDEPARVVGELETVDDGEVARLDVYLDSYDYGAPVESPHVLDWVVDESAEPPTVTARVKAGDHADLEFGFVTVVVRDETGQIVTGTQESMWELAAGETGSVEVPLWEIEELPTGYEIEATAATQ